MKPPLFVKNQGKNVKRSFSLRTLFNLLFLISLGLNTYFLFFQSELSSVANAYDVGLKEKKIAENGRVGSHSLVLQSQSSDSGLNTNIHEEDPIRNLNSTEALPYKVEQVLFGSSIQSNEPNIQTLQLKVKNSLSYTVCQGVELRSECDAFTAHLARLLVWFLDVNKEMRNGDDLSVVYERLDNQDQFKILQLIYKSSYLKKTLEANFYKAQEMKYGGYFDRNGKEITQRIVKKQSPIDEYVEIVSLPGDFRKGRRGHAGTDFKAKIGTPIRSTFDGRVNRTNWNIRANGYCLEIDHPNQKIKTRYLHLSRVLVKRGQFVKQGEIIAESGNTGRSFAPHLHYEVRSRDKRNTIYNPFDFKYHKTYYRNISDQASGEFQKIISAYDALRENNKIDRIAQTG